MHISHRQIALAVSALLLLPAATANAQSGRVSFDWAGEVQPVSAVQTPNSLEGLQKLALENNPTLEQARAGVKRSRGKRIQAGLYPNPTLGYTASEIGNDGEAGQQGAFLGQEIVTAGKLRLSRNVASYKLKQSEWSYSAQEMRVANAVRQEYYKVLVAEQMRDLSQDIVKLTNAGYQAVKTSLRDRGTQRDLLRAKIEVDRAYLLMTSAQNDYLAAWRRLAIVVGDSELSAVHLEGDLRKNIPALSWQGAWQRVAENNPLLCRTREGVELARAALRRSRVEPIPNVTLQGTAQYDFSTRTHVAGVQIGIPLPVRNRNQGNISAAEADYIRAVQEVDRQELLLQRLLADVFRDYATSRAQVTRYQKSIVPSSRESLDLHRALFNEGEINYIELLTAQRDFTRTNQEYVQALAKLWENVVLVDGLLLVDGLAEPEAGLGR